MVTVERADCVRLQLPVDPQYMRVARLVASGLGATIGFDVEAVDDFRIAVDELCAALMEVSDGDDLDLAFEVRADGIEVEGHTLMAAMAQPSPDRFALSEQILGVACDRYSLNIDGRSARFTLYKRV